MILLSRPGRVRQIFDAPASDCYRVTSAALLGFLLFAYVWLARRIVAGLDYAWTVVNLLAILNVFLGVLFIFQGTGLPMIVLSILVLLLNNTRGVREWYADS